MSVEQKIPTWTLKNFKYEVGLTRCQSDFIRDKLFYFSRYRSFKQVVFPLPSKPRLFNLTLEMIYCLKRLYLEVFVVMRDNKLQYSDQTSGHRFPFL